jgi:hypothetical protein
VIEYEKTVATADQRILITNEYALETDDTEIKISVALTESGELWRASPFQLGTPQNAGYTNGP